MGEVRIGTSGWSYPSGPGAWNGIFYPSRRSRGAGRAAKAGDLVYYAEHFDTVEVNSSFYRIPDPAIASRWAAQTPSRFDFCLKLFQQFTHPAMYLRTAGASAGGEESPIPAVAGTDVDAFRRSIEPIASAGKLGALLAQFPPAFRHGAEASGYLAWLMQAFSDYPVAVELRHRSWSDREQDVLDLLRAHGAAWAQIDEPKFRFSIRQSRLSNLGSLYYMRLHGRNAEKWWQHDHPDERYNYLYSPAEIEGFADTVTRVRELVQKIYVFMNNHFAGKAVANAAALRHAVGQPVPGGYEDEMLARYPFLEGIVARTGADLLFDGLENEGGDGPGGTDTAEDAEPREG
ncbi:MAG: DUF72 domain-containing protein [Vicinamibacterales bacterium]